MSCCLLGPDSLPAGGEEGTGEPEERSGQEDQDAGVRPKTGEVGSVCTTCTHTPTNRVSL